MARPRKEGLDYFPHDTDAVNDEKIEALRMLHGNDGYAFYFILLERIYRTNNAELSISDAETIQILSKKVGVNEDKFMQMLNTALKYGCFDQKEYEKRKVLTSNGIKKRAGIVVEKRLKMRARYNEKAEKISAAETREETQPETGESKEKKSKVKKSKNNIYICADEPHLSKDSSKNKKFIPPTVEEITAYCKERNNNIDPQQFFDFYESKGWMVGKNKMKDWKAAVRTWERRDTSKSISQKKSPAGNFKQRQYDDDFFKNLYENIQGSG